MLPYNFSWLSIWMFLSYLKKKEEKKNVNLTVAQDTRHIYISSSQRRREASRVILLTQAQQSVCIDLICQLLNGAHLSSP